MGKFGNIVPPSGTFPATKDMLSGIRTNAFAVNTGVTMTRVLWENRWTLLATAYDYFWPGGSTTMVASDGREPTAPVTLLARSASYTRTKTKKKKRGLWIDPRLQLDLTRGKSFKMTFYKIY
jgi:hypothetical protein